MAGGNLCRPGVGKAQRATGRSAAVIINAIIDQIGQGGEWKVVMNLGLLSTSWLEDKLLKLVKVTDEGYHPKRRHKGLFIMYNIEDRMVYTPEDL